MCASIEYQIMWPWHLLQTWKSLTPDYSYQQPAQTFTYVNLFQMYFGQDFIEQIIKDLWRAANLK